MSSTIQEIADKLGISKTTVHRALNNTGRISPQTKKLVLKTAEEMDYTPNDIARSLRSKCSMTIGLILRGILVGHYYSEILAGIEEISTESGYVINIACSSDDVYKEQKIIENFYRRQVDGIIIAPVAGSLESNYTLLKKRNIPFVFIDKYVENVDADVVTADSFSGTKKAVHFLISTGRKRIAYLNGFEGKSVTVLERINAYYEQLKAEKSNYSKLIESEYFGNDDRLCGYSAIKHFFSQCPLDERPDAIVCTNDSLAFGALKAFKELDIKVPDDVAIIGNNNDDMTEYIFPMLSTISQPKQEMGRMAMRLILKRIENPQQNYSFNRLPVILLVRDST